MERATFFNSNSGDRIYDASDFAAYFADLATDGIFYRDTNNLRVTAGTGMNVTVAAGSAFINGYHYRNTTALNLVIATADGVNPRIDRVVLRLDMSARNISLAVLKGTAAATPAAPNLTRSSDVWDLCLANVSVLKAAVKIETANITDTRLDTSLCGLVNSLVSAVYE